MTVLDSLRQKICPVQTKAAALPLHHHIGGSWEESKHPRGEGGRFAHTVDRTNPKEHMLAHGQIDPYSIQAIGIESTNGVHTGVIRHEGQRQYVVIKPHGEQRSTSDPQLMVHEHAAYLIDRAMGHHAHVPVTTHGETPRGEASIQEHVTGAATFTEKYGEDRGFASLVRHAVETRDATYRNDYRHIAVLDAVIGNPDRFGDNILVNDEHGARYGVPKGLVAIDHGNAFSTPRTWYPGQHDSALAHQQQDKLREDDMAALHQLATNRPQVTEELRAIGLPDWKIAGVHERTDWLLRMGRLPSSGEAIRS